MAPWAFASGPARGAVAADVNAMEPTGTPAEVERSLASLAGAEAPLAALLPAVVEPALAKTIKRRKLK